MDMAFFRVFITNSDLRIIKFLSKIIKKGKEMKIFFKADASSTYG